MSKLRVAVVQSCTAAYSIPDTLGKLERLANEAKSKGAQLAVFPEAFIGGYPMWRTFGTVMGVRTASGREDYLQYHSSAVAIPSPEITRIEAISKQTGLFLLVGIIEKDLGSCFCTIVFIDPEQGYLSKHRKIVPTAMERIIWGRGDATTLPVPEVTFKPPSGSLQPVKAKISATICWENYMPLLRTYYYSKGTQIYCAPTADDSPDWQDSMRHIALEGRCFVLSSCQYSQEKDFPPDHPVEFNEKRDPERVIMTGGSVIINPAGNILAGPLFEGEGVLVADIDLEDTIRGNLDLDVVGHYARPDIFQLNVVGT